MNPKVFGKRIALTALPPLLLFAVVIALWHACVVAFQLKPYVLPSPVAVGQALVNNRVVLRQAVMYTGAAALCGFSASLLVGTLIAFVFAQSRMIRASGYPYFIFLQTVPIVAIAPLITRWCGNGFQSVVLVSFILSLFPILSNATQGLLEIDPDLLDLFRLNNATRWQMLIKLRFPSAIPGILAGARTSSGLAIIGAIVGEYFVGYDSKWFGLSHLIYTADVRLEIDSMLAAVLTSTLLGVVNFGFVNLISMTILRKWYDGPVEHRR